MVKILLDAMGGDNAPASNVKGAVLALAKDKELYLILKIGRASCRERV